MIFFAAFLLTLRLSARKYEIKKTLMSTEMSGQIYIKTLYAQNNIFKKGIPNMRFLLLANHGELQIVNYK